MRFFQRHCVLGLVPDSASLAVRQTLKIIIKQAVNKQQGRSRLLTVAVSTRWGAEGWFEMTNGEAAEPEGVTPEPRSLTEHTQILTLPPEAEAPLGRGHPAVPVGVAGVEEGPDANLVLVQVDGGQLGLVQVEVAVGVQLGEHPAYGVLAARHQAPVQHCKHKTAGQNNWPRRPSRQLHKLQKKRKKKKRRQCLRQLSMVRPMSIILLCRRQTSACLLWRKIEDLCVFFRAD